MTAKLSLPKSAELLALDERRTQGKWSYTRPYDAVTSKTLFRLATDSDKVIASGYGPNDSDAAFIASAPDLAAQHRLALEVLREMAEALKMCDGVYEIPDRVQAYITEALSLIKE